MGFARFLGSCTAFGRPRTWSVRFSKPFPLALTLRSFSLSGSRPLVTAPLPKESFLRRLARSPSGVPSRRWSVEVRSVLPRLRPSRPRPQGFHPPESPLPSQDVSALSGPMLPWALDRLVRMSAAHEAPTRPSGQVVPPRRFQAVAASVTTREWRGRQDLGLSGSERADAGCHPEG